MQKFGQKNMKTGADEKMIAGLMGFSKSAIAKHPDHSEVSREAIAGLLKLQEQPIIAITPSRNEGLTPLQIAEHAANPVQVTPECPPDFNKKHDAPTSLLPHMENIVVRQHIYSTGPRERGKSSN